MSSNILDRLFGSSARVKIIRLFLLNPDIILDSKEISRRSRVSPDVTRREISVLKKIDFIKGDSHTIEELIKLKKGKVKNKKKKISGYKLNEFFPLLHALKSLVLNAAPLDKEKMLKTLKSLGRMKLIVLAGIFIQSDESRLDLLLVGDGVKKGVLERVLKGIEADVGKELTYAVFNTNEFSYRISMYDRFIRDVLDYPHERILDKLDI